MPPEPNADAPPTTWDIFCRVIDNYGDAGVCCRLARELARRGHGVRLFCDDLALASRLLADSSSGGGPQLWPWLPDEDPFWANTRPAEVVIEAFACDPPAAFISQMARAPRPPVWINLEYLSAERWVDEVHGLPSPQWHGPGTGLTKWFFHPGFSPSTGGLIRERDLDRRLTGWDAVAWRQARGWTLAPGEWQIALFCYEQPMLQALLDWLSQLGIRAHVLATAGGASDQARNCRWPPGLRWTALDWLSQADFDHLLWSSDLNLVRGEDSLVRAIWAGKPFVWQLYPQSDGAHGDKARAFLERFLGDQVWPELGEHVRAFWGAWNGMALDSGPGPWFGEGMTSTVLNEWRILAQEFRTALSTGPELVTALQAFVASHGSTATDRA